MNEIQGKTILVTGPAGQIAFPLSARLARDNEVWGIARFSDARSRQRCEEAGIRTRIVDLADPDWSELPERYVDLLGIMGHELWQAATDPEWAEQFGGTPKQILELIGKNPGS